MTFLPLSIDDIIALPWRIVNGIASAPASIVGKLVRKTEEITKKLETEKEKMEGKEKEKKEGGE